MTCPKCAFLNQDTQENCVNCGNQLKPKTEVATEPQVVNEMVPPTNPEPQMETIQPLESMPEMGPINEPQPVAPLTDLGTPPPQPKPKSKKGLIIVLVSILLIVGVVVAFLFLNNNDTPINNEPPVTDNGDETDPDDDGDITASPTLITDLQNYRFTMEATFEVEDEGQMMNMRMTGSGIVDLVSQIQHMNMEIDAIGVRLPFESYEDFGRGLTFTSFMGMWSVSDGASEPAGGLTDVIELFSNIGSVTKISEEVYHLRMSAEQVRELLASVDDTIDTTGMMTDGLFYVVHVRNGFIYRLEFEATNFAPGLPSIRIIYTFSDHNNAGTVTIPQTVIDSAIPAE